jgi:effector-binding domain-containing protein
MNSAPEMISLAAGPAIAIRAQVPLAELPRFFGGAFGELAAYGADHVAGPPFARYHTFDPARIDIEAVMPLDTPLSVSGRVRAITLVAGPAVQVRHFGSYDDLGDAYRTIDRWIDDHHRHRIGLIREVYMTEPAEPPADHLTIVIQPLQADPPTDGPLTP